MSEAWWTPIQIYEALIHNSLIDLDQQGSKAIRMVNQERPPGKPNRVTAGSFQAAAWGWSRSGISWSKRLSPGPSLCTEIESDPISKMG